MMSNWIGLFTLGAFLGKFAYCIPTHYVPNEREYKIDNGVLHYLRRFGYLEESPLGVNNLMSEDYVRNALGTMQRFAGIPETGRLDSATRELMSRPRCGLPDMETGRVKRYAKTGKSWKNNSLTWSLRKGTQKIPDGYIRREAGRALNLWSEASLLNFTEINSDKADILIYFHKGDHGDNYKFDGPSNTLAHAFHPGSGIGGDAHFDDEENWVHHVNPDENRGSTSFFTVALHEFGHSLGLSHTNQEGAIMLPFYFPIHYDFQLHSDDVAGIQSLYGSRYDDNAPLPPMKPLETTIKPKVSTTKLPKGATTPKRLPVDAEVPNTCDTSYDAITVIRSSIFMFKDKYLWSIPRNRLTPYGPIPIPYYFPGLPSDISGIDAIYQQKMRPRSILIFSGNQFWNSTETLNISGPFPLTRLGLPSGMRRLNAAFIWGHNGKSYFFNDTMYWRFDEKTGRVEADYPRDIAVWKGVPYDIDSAFQYTNGKTYFFKGRVFWEFNDRKMSVASYVPALSSTYWMGCSSAQLKAGPKNLSSKCSSHARDTLVDFFAFILILANYLA